MNSPCLSTGSWIARAAGLAALAVAMAGGGRLEAQDVSKRATEAIEQAITHLQKSEFDEAIKAQPDASSHAKTALGFIRELYGIERMLNERDVPVTAEERLAVRRERSRPVVERFHTWLEALAPQVLPEGRLGKATMDIAANDLIWDFFKRHPMK